MTREQLDEKAEQAAKKARCGRCTKVVLEQPKRAHIVWGTIRIPARDSVVHFQLCGPCAFDARKFLGAL